MEDKIDRRWRKSSYSGNGGGNCVEVAAGGADPRPRFAGPGRTGAPVPAGRMAQVR